MTTEIFETLRDKKVRAGRIGGRPRRLRYSQFLSNLEINQSSENIKNKKIERRIRTKSVGTNESDLIRGLVNLEYGI
jgi:hypothetical protein